jgi:hypothetical protein
MCETEYIFTELPYSFNWGRLLIFFLLKNSKIEILQAARLPKLKTFS